MKCAFMVLPPKDSLDNNLIWGMFTFDNLNERSWSNFSGTPENPYTELKFENGTPCWNGPQRRMTVRLSCGPEEKVVSVSEPAKCEYLMIMETSVLCSDEDHNRKENSYEKVHHEDL